MMNGLMFGGEPSAGMIEGFDPAVIASLDPGMDTMVTAYYVITQADIDNGADIENGVLNTATATGTPPSGPPIDSPEDDAVTQFESNPGLSIVKSITPMDDTITVAGQVLSYEFEVTNTGNTTIDNIVVSDAGPSFGGAAGTNTMSVMSCPMTSLAPGASTTCTATYVVSQADIDNASGDDSLATNIASVTGTPPNLPELPPVLDTLEVPVDPMPMLTVEKTASAPSTVNGDPNLIDEGDIITYTYEVTNTGNVELTGVTVNDAGPTFNGVLGTGTFSPITCDATILAPGESTTCTATYILTQADIDSAAVDMDSVINIATVSGIPPLGPPVVSPPDTAVTFIPDSVALAIVKEAGVPTMVNGADPLLTDGGDMIAYTFTVTNTGNVTLTDVFITDDGITFGGQAAQGSLSAISCDATTLASGESTTCTATYTLEQADVDNSAGIPNGIKNLAKATGTPPDGPDVESPQDSAFTEIVSGPMLTIDKQVDSIGLQVGDPNFVDVMDTIYYKYTLTNTGNVTLTGVVVNDTMLTFGGEPSAGMIEGFDPAVIASLDPGMDTMVTAYYVITQADIDNGADIENGVLNTATATGTPPSGPPIDSPEDDAVTQFESNPGLSIVKSITPMDDTITVAGQVLSYEFEVTNTGNTTIDNIVVSDAGPSFGGAAGTNTMSVMSCPMTSLAPGASTTCTATYVVSQADIDNASGDDSLATNIASVTGTPPNLPELPPVLDTLEVPVDPMPMLTVEKTASAPSTVNGDPNLIDEGDIITYTYEVTNTGNEELTGVTVNDAGPNSMAYWEPGPSVRSPVMRRYWRPVRVRRVQRRIY